MLLTFFVSVSTRLSESEKGSRFTHEEFTSKAATGPVEAAGFMIAVRDFTGALTVSFAGLSGYYWYAENRREEAQYRKVKTEASWTSYFINTGSGYGEKKI